MSQYWLSLQLRDVESFIQQAPIFFYFAQFALVGEGFGKYGVDEGVGEEADELWRTALAGNFVGEQRVVEDAPANHHVVDVGEAAAYVVVLLRGADVAVVNYRMLDEGQHLCEGVEVGGAAVLLFADARMDGDIGKGKAVEYGYDGEYLVGFGVAQPHLNAQLVGDAGHHMVEYPLDFAGVGQYAAAAVFASHPAYRTTDVPVYLVVSQFVESCGNLDKLVGFLAQYLGYYGNGVAVVFGQYVGQPVAGIGEFAVGERYEGAYRRLNGTGKALLDTATEQYFG